MPYLGEVRLFAGKSAPRGWTICQGQHFAKSTEIALDAILGTLHGGTSSNPALPKLSGRVAIHPSAAQPIGSSGGTNSVALTVDHLPTHGHGLMGTSAATAYVAEGHLLAQRPAGKPSYGALGNVACSPAIIKTAGGGMPHSNLQPYLVLNYIIATSEALYPNTVGAAAASDEEEPLVGEIGLFPYDFVPEGWYACDGARVAVRDNAMLYAVIGTQFGPLTDADGVALADTESWSGAYFALPDLRGRVAMGTDSSRTGVGVGSYGGEAEVTLSVDQMPMHTHSLYGTSSVATSIAPTDNVLAKPPYTAALYSKDATQAVAMAATAVTSTGNGAPHNNLMPYLALRYCICVSGAVSFG